jgi:MerR family mercuric resistance operon transcriptional regulator
MNVSEIAREVGIAPSAVRFYERKGVLPTPPRRSNGYREYGDDDLCRLRVVASLRRLGLGLVDAGRLASLSATGQCDLMSHDLRPLVAAQREAVARSRAELDRLDRQLTTLEAALAGTAVEPNLCLEERR